MARKARKAAEYVARRTGRLASQDLPPAEEARSLLRLLAKADDRRFWRGLEPWPEDVEGVFGPVVERLTDLGVEAVDAILELEPPDNSWQAELASGVLAFHLGRGGADDRVADAVSWGLRLADHQEEGFAMTMEELTSRAGPAAEGPLERFMDGHDDPNNAAVVVSFALQDADPAWACGAAMRMTREALDAGDLGRADPLSYAAATAGGREALPLVGEVLDRMAAEGVERDRMVQGAFEASLLLGAHPGPAWDEDVERTLAGTTMDEYSTRLGDDDLLGVVSEGGHHLERRELARACCLLGLEDRGSKPELLERLDSAFDVQGTDDGGRLSPPPLESLTTVRLRELCRALRLDPGGTREELLERLVAFKEEVDMRSGLEHTRAELDAMDIAELREVCRDVGLDTGGKRRALVARIQMAQEDLDRG